MTYLIIACLVAFFAALMLFARVVYYWGMPKTLDGSVDWFFDQIGGFEDCRVLMQHRTETDWLVKFGDRYEWMLFYGLRLRGRSPLLKNLKRGYGAIDAADACLIIQAAVWRRANDESPLTREAARIRIAPSDARGFNFS